MAQPRRVVVIGGGMAGMEAARVAAEYGHEVTLVERSRTLGGHFIEACAPSFKYEARGVLDWERRQIERSSVEVLLGTEATPELIRDLKPEALIIAVGSHYIVPPIPGIERALTAEDVLLDHGKAQGRMVVIGGAVKGRKLYNCMHEAWLAVRAISGVVF